MGGGDNNIIIFLHVSVHFEQFDVLSENRNKGWDIWVMKLRPPPPLLGQCPKFNRFLILEASLSNEVKKCTQVSKQHNIAR